MIATPLLLLLVLLVVQFRWSHWTGPAVVPGMHLPVRAVSQGVVEVFRPNPSGFGNSEVPSGPNPSVGGG
jgi:hypothetical protein